MRKYIRKSITLFLALAVVMAMALAVSASTVTFDGNAKKFIFAPGSEQSPTDLFDNFKGMMPGDTETEEITVSNSANYGVKIYLRSLGATENSRALLSHLTLSVWENGKTELFHAPASQTAQLSDWVLLGEMDPGGKANLFVKVEVPTDLGDEFQQGVGELTWEFKVDQIPAPEPKTADDTLIWPYIVIGGIGVALIAASVVMKKRKKETA